MHLGARQPPAERSARSCRRCRARRSRHRACARWNAAATSSCRRTCVERRVRRRRDLDHRIVQIGALAAATSPAASATRRRPAAPRGADGSATGRAASPVPRLTSSSVPASTPRRDRRWRRRPRPAWCSARPSARARAAPACRRRAPRERRTAACRAAAIGQIVAEASVHEHEPRRLDRRQPRRAAPRIGQRRQRLAKRRLRQRRAGWCISTPRRARAGRPAAAERLRRGRAHRGVAGQPTPQPLVAREESRARRHAPRPVA